MTNNENILVYIYIFLLVFQEKRNRFNRRKAIVIVEGGSYGAAAYGKEKKVEIYNGWN